MNASYSISSISFTGNAYTLTNSNSAVLTLGAGGITNSSTNLQTINFTTAIILSAAQTWSATSGALTVTGGITNGGNLLTISGSSATALNGIITGAGGLTKTGIGNLTLSRTNTYTGATTISSGTVTLTGTDTIARSTLITLAAGANLNVTGVTAGPWTVGGITAQVLAGQGTVTGPARIGSFGTHASGGSGAVGTQAFSSTLDYASSSIFEWDLNAISASNPGVVSNAATGTYDKVTAVGALSGASSVFKVVLGGGDFTTAFWDSNKSWTDIITAGSGSASLASIFTSFSATGGLTSTGVVSGEGQFSFTGNTLNWTAVPEPSSALAGLLVGAGLLRRRRF
ncbi:MAG: autotransporter-associated beta strand repeat-containing protein [Luteolibacter sp.]